MLVEIRNAALKYAKIVIHLEDVLSVMRKIVIALILSAIVRKGFIITGILRILKIALLVKLDALIAIK
jgi:hypothetical protein